MTFEATDPRYKKHEMLKEHYAGKLTAMAVGTTIEVAGRKIRRDTLEGWSNGGPPLHADSMAGWCALYARVKA
jgi:hypothetical protein